MWLHLLLRALLLGLVIFAAMAVYAGLGRKVA